MTGRRLPLLDLGDRVQGVAIDADLWSRESRVVRLRPERFATGEVMVLWPHAPHIAGVRTATGEALTLRVQR